MHVFTETTRNTAPLPLRTGLEGCMTKHELAQYLRVSVSLINKLMFEAGLPHLKIGRSVRFRLADVLVWFELKGMKV